MLNPDNASWNRASDTLSLEDGYYHEWSARAVLWLVGKHLTSAWHSYHDGHMMGATEQGQCEKTGALKALHYRVRITIDVEEVTE